MKDLLHLITEYLLNLICQLNSKFPKSRRKYSTLISCMFIFRICIVTEIVRDNNDESFSDAEFFHVYWYLVETMCLIYM